MEFSIRIKTFVIICAINCLLMACSTDTRQEAKSGLEEFSGWVDEKAKRAETATEEEWNEMQAEYELKSKELETNSADWDDKTKAEWEELKKRWNETESKAEARFRDAKAEVDVDSK